jgi:hypothetical protein
MATRGSIPKVMESAGIDMLPPEAGVPLIRRELTAGGTRGEIVIGQRLGVLLKEWDPTGGVETNASDTPEKELSPQGPMIGKVASMGLYSGLVVESTLDPKTQPFLYDHQIDGTPVLPGVMGIEAFAEAALRMLPGWHVKAIEEIAFLAPFKFYRHEPRTVTVEVSIHSQAEELVASCRLIGRRTLPNQSEPQTTTHFTGRVRLTKSPAQMLSVSPPTMHLDRTVDAADIYRIYFHGPAYQVLERAWWDGNRMIGLLAKNLPANHHPAQLPTVMSPRLIELCFQTAGLWEIGKEGSMGLPRLVNCVTASCGATLSDTRFYAVITPDPVSGSFDAEVVDASGKRYVQLSGYRTVATPNAVNTDQLKALRNVMSQELVAA